MPVGRLRTLALYVTMLSMERLPDPGLASLVVKVVLAIVSSLLQPALLYGE